ncbi:MAG: hypothetical protein H8E37_09975, partial [Planctomycetes bacterium]|nr:hypothetical protein [Planctomycetota bacterium]
QVTWDGGLVVKRHRIVSFQPFNFWNPEKRCEQISDRELKWQSLTTGGTAGVILNLEKPGGTIDVTTTQASLTVRGDEPGTRGEPVPLGGVGKQLQGYQLPPEGGSCELSSEFQPMKQMLNKGDNPIYVCVVQEDGHMAWSSPIYLVRQVEFCFLTRVEEKHFVDCSSLWMTLLTCLWRNTPADLRTGLWIRILR